MLRYFLRLLLATVCYLYSIEYEHEFLADSLIYVPLLNLYA